MIIRNTKTFFTILISTIFNIIFIKMLNSILYDYPGIAVDTHVNRVSNRLNLVNSTNPDIIERELMMLNFYKYKT